MEARLCNRGSFLLLFSRSDFPRRANGSGRAVGEPRQARSSVFWVSFEWARGACAVRPDIRFSKFGDRTFLLVASIRLSGVVPYASCIEVQLHGGGATMLISAGSGPTPEFSPASCCAPWKMEPAPPTNASIAQPHNLSPNGKSI